MAIKRDKQFVKTVIPCIVEKKIFKFYCKKRIIQIIFSM